MASIIERSVILSGAACGGVEESTHYRFVVQQFGAKILRLVALAQDDTPFGCNGRAMISPYERTTTSVPALPGHLLLEEKAFRAIRESPLQE